MSTSNLHWFGKGLKIAISSDEYYDFTLSDNRWSSSGEFSDLNAGFPTGCTIAHIDFSDPNTFISGSTTIKSSSTWTGATNDGVYSDTIGLTGLDNGLITFLKSSGDTSNQILLSALTGSTLVIPSGSTEFIMNPVTGNTGDYVYPKELITNGFDYMGFCGGLYQGFFKLDGFDYQTLPEYYPDGLMLDFWVNKGDKCLNPVTGQTLNDTYPDNEGIFFYLGTRAEHKFWDEFQGLNTGSTSGCTSGATEFCTIPKESDITIIDKESGVEFNLVGDESEVWTVDNQFLIYGQADGEGLGTRLASKFTGTTMTVTKKDPKDVGMNEFLYYSVRNVSKDAKECTPGKGTPTPVEPVNNDADYGMDLLDNAFALRIKEDGSLGYRSLTLAGNCGEDMNPTGYTVDESYSASGTVINDVWTKITVKFVFPPFTNRPIEGCPMKPRVGSLYFYVNGRLVHVANNVSEIAFKRLNTNYQKQVGVPYNLSLGGGTQGLLESMTFDGQDPKDQGLPIERFFAGTFIGGIKSFKILSCNAPWHTIYNDYLNTNPSA